MIRKLLATTAVASILASGAIAQTTTTPAPANPPATEAAPAAPLQPGVAVDQSQVSHDGQLASNLVGETVYNGTGDDAQNVGEVNDLVLSKDGMVEAIVIGVGGFLGIGEKDVAIDFKSIDWAERDGDRWIVIAGTADQLKELPAFDRSAYAPAATAANNGRTAATPSSDMRQNNTAAPAANDTTAQAPAATTTPSGTAAAPAATDSTKTAAIDRSKLKDLDVAKFRTEDFVGTTVYGANDENIGEIGDVVMDGDKIDAVVIDVGGFLGMGEKEVAVGMDNLSWMTDEDGDKYLYTTFTKEQLEAAPAFDEANYAANRDTMRVTVPN